MIPVVYWLVLFSIIFHGLSIPALDVFYRWKGVRPIVEDSPAEVQVLSSTEALPNNTYRDPSKRNSVMAMNRFSRSSTIKYNSDDNVDNRPNSWRYMNKKGGSSRSIRSSDSAMATDMLKMLTTSSLSPTCDQYMIATG